ncbi:MAG TPA: type II toxin-antitoxin system prevent-host-death family antitoxin [Gemmatimonadota bacterium]|nr:type II toxin-antitoxin system prevent-host-death family antitoxin [Gemmatimonadota bacterium]
MTIRTSYTHARANLAKLLDRVVMDRETVIIERRGAKEVALISAEELAGLEETAHLLRSPENAERLLAALARALGRTVEPSSVEEFRRALGLEPEEAA